MEKFLKALRKTLKWEGGISNNPADKGGYTNRGVSLRFLKAIGLDLNSDGVINELDLKNINDNSILYIYKTYFWDKLRADEISSLPIASHLFDIAVNSGNKRAVRLIQETCNYFEKELKVDGVMGEKTIKAINECVPLLLNTALYYNRVEFYENIVKSNPSQKVFLLGWKRRAEDFILGIDFESDDGQV